MVTLSEKIDSNIVREPEPQPWWKCCCPKKDTDEVRPVRRRRQSIAMAEQALKEVSQVQTESKDNIEAEYLALTFVPDFIIQEIFENSFRTVPFIIPSNVVLVMVDVCGFTKLCESYCKKGVSGIEELASVLNGFMSTLSAMLLEGGGDILNFAGDAFLVQWAEEIKFKGLQNAAKKAYECAVNLQVHPCLQTKNLDGTMKVKIGIAIGEIQTWVLGSPSEFLLFVAAGPTIPCVQKAEGLCDPGDIVITRDVYKMLKTVKVNMHTVTELEDGYRKINEFAIPTDEAEPVPNRISLFKECQSEHISMSKVFLIPPLRGLQSASELEYISELTMVTILFIALLEVEIADPKILDSTFDIILESVKKFEGILNKMLLFDKGCTFLVAFGLPGVKHSNDAARGICCAENIIKRLNEIHINASIGITTGTCFCGIVGHPQRQEYTVIGSRVNMAARLMVYYKEQPISLNVETYHLSRDELGERNFVELPARELKGIEAAGPIYAYRRQATRDTPKELETFEFVEDESLHGSEKEKEKIRQCVAAMCDEQQRKEMLEKNLLPVMIIKGRSGSGKSYLMYFTVDVAVSTDCKFSVCCGVPSYFHQPFFVVSRLIRRMLGMTMTESSIDRENIIMAYLPNSEYRHLYLLNHLFNIHFPIPEDVAFNVGFRDEKITELCKMIIREYSKNRNTVLAVDNADYMDDQSWYIIHQLSEEKRILIILSLSVDFKEVNTSASAILLKAYAHINTESLGEDFFAPLLCWFLGVKAVHTKLYVYLKEVTQGKAQLLKEISLAPSTAQIIKIIPLESLNAERLKKEFYLDQFVALNDDNPMACDLKSEADLRRTKIPTNVNDAVKESLNNLNIQDRLLLKRATVLGEDFDLHSLEAISSGMKRAEVLQCISNLLSNHIFASACTLENVVDMTSKIPSVTLNRRNICFCFTLYLRTRLKRIMAAEWPIGPYHRLKFRTNDFRLSILAHMTKDQLYSMRLEVADNLERNGPECAACKGKRVDGMEIQSGIVKKVRSYSIDVKKCTCLGKRPKLYSDISSVYECMGMVFLPPYFMKKSAQTINNINLPIGGLYYIQTAEAMMPNYRLMTIEDKWELEAYFDPVVLEASLKKTKAECFLKLGDTYHAAASAFQAIDMLGIDAVCFHGVFSPGQFNKILPKFNLSQAEYITKLSGVLAKVYLQARTFKLAQDLLRIEHVALKLYPIDFLQVLNHMKSMYQLKYLIREHEKLANLEHNIFRLCHDKLRNFEEAMDLTETVGIGSAYAVILEVRLSLNQLQKAENAADEAIKILQLVNDRVVLPKIRIFLSHIHYHNKQYEDCCNTVISLGEMAIASRNRVFRALYMSCLTMFLRKSSEGINKTDLQLTIDKCNAFATSWKLESAQALPKHFAFYTSICLARWCLYSDSKTMWIAGKTIFKQCYDLTIHLYSTIDRSKHNYWVICAFLLLLKLQVKSLKEEHIDGVTPDEQLIKKDLLYLETTIKTYYPVFRTPYKKLAAIFQEKKKPETKQSSEIIL